MRDMTHAFKGHETFLIVVVSREGLATIVTLFAHRSRSTSTSTAFAFEGQDTFVCET